MRTAAAIAFALLHARGIATASASSVASTTTNDDGPHASRRHHSRRLQTSATTTTTTTTGNGNGVTDNAPSNNATIGGTVFEDLDWDGMRDLDDPPVAGVGVSLFSCLTGIRVFETMSGDDGTYLLPVSSSDATMDGGGGDEGCYYVQFEVGGDYAYTSPINGETSDLYVAFPGNGADGGGGMTDVDAGIAYTSTYPPAMDPAPSSGGSAIAATVAPTSAIAASDNITDYPTYSPTATHSPTSEETNEKTTASPTISHMPSTTSPITVEPASSSPTTYPPTSAPTASDDERDDEGDDDAPPPQPQPQSTPLDATISVRMYDVTSAMEYSSQSVYVNACGSFLNHQLKIATPPVYDLTCDVLGQESERSSSSSSSSGRIRHRTTRADELIDESQRNSLIVETRVTGKSNGTSYASNDTKKFTDLLIGTFNVQGYLFLEELREGEGGDADYFDDVGDIRGSYANDVALANDADGDVEEVDGVKAVVRQLSHLHIGVIATAVSIFAFLLCCCICRVRRRRMMNEYDGDSEKATTGVAVGKAGGGGRRSNKIPPLASADEAAVGNGMETDLPGVVTASSSSSSSAPPLIELENIPKGGGMAMRRDVLAPRGKLGVVVANAFRPNVSGAVRYGPAVHSLKDGSPMTGLLYEGDVIVAVNDVDTSQYTVERLSQLLIDTVGRERKISVLGSRR